MKRSAAAWLGRGAGGPAADGSGALIRHPAMDDWVRRVCAVHADGRCLIAEGHESDSRLRAALLALRRDRGTPWYGSAPASLVERTASLDEIAECWRAADREAAGGEAPAARRVRMLFEEAAAARASDVVFENDSGLCRVHGIVNDRKLQLADPLPADEGREVMGFLFHCKDEGSAQTSYQRSAFQGFSIRAGGQVPLPATVSALRCQRGPHEPDGDHLFARLFYRDRIERGTTLESLGFSPEEAAVFSEIRMSLRGGIFLGGTAGDGKSTTLATNLALQMEEAEGQLNVVTIEDPVEYPILGAVQIAVPTTGSGEERGKHFRGCAHALLPGPSRLRDGLGDPGCRRGATGAAVHRYRPPSVDHHPRPLRQRHPLPPDGHGPGHRRGVQTRQHRAADEADPAAASL